MDLRERLIAADEAHDPCSNGPRQGRSAHWWCNCGAKSDEPTALDANKAAYEHMADVNQAVVAAWLRDQSHDITANWPEDTDIAIASALYDLADAIDPQPERTAP